MALGQKLVLADAFRSFLWVMLGDNNNVLRLQGGISVAASKENFSLTLDQGFLILLSCCHRETAKCLK